MYVGPKSFIIQEVTIKRVPWVSEDSEAVLRPRKRMEEIGLRTFCIVIWSQPMGSRGWNVAVSVRVASVGSFESPLDGTVWVGQEEGPWREVYHWGKF